MNPGLAGFEFYDVEPAAEQRALARPLQPDWEYEGAVHDLPELRVRARRMTRGMMEVNFPQYIHREARDFFYLTRRALLPGPDLAPLATPAEPGEGVWRVKGLPQHGFPYAMATTALRPDPAEPAAKVQVLRLDPKALRPAASAGTTEQTPTVVSLFSSGRAPLALFWQDELFLIAASGGERATKIAAGVPVTLARPAMVRVVVGVEDLDGMLDWVEVDAKTETSPGLLAAIDRLLGQLGCSHRLALEGEGRALVGASTDLEGVAAVSPPLPFVRFVRGAMPAAHLSFESTPIVGPSVWQPLQSKRVRYFPKPSRPAASASGAASAGPPPPGPTSTPPPPAATP
jgi:hypothetical protein